MEGIHFMAPQDFVQGILFGIPVAQHIVSCGPEICLNYRKTDDFHVFLMNFKVLLSQSGTPRDNL